MQVGGQSHIPAALSPGMTQYQLHRKLDDLQGPSVLHGKLRPTPGIDPRTVQQVDSRYTDAALYCHVCSVTALPHSFLSHLLGRK